MRLAGAIIALIAGIFATFAAGFTLFVGGIGGALRTDNADLVIALGWGGVAFSFLTIVFGAIGIGNRSKTPGFLLVLSSIAGAILGGTFVAVFMALALIGGILVAIGGGSSSSSLKSSPRMTTRADKICAKCNSSIGTDQMFCGNCGASVGSTDRVALSDSAGASRDTASSHEQLDPTAQASAPGRNGSILPWFGYGSVGLVIGAVAFFVVSADSNEQRVPNSAVVATAGAPALASSGPVIAGVPIPTIPPADESIPREGSSTSALLSGLLTPDILGTSIAHLEQKVGPAYRTIGQDSIYVVGQCQIIVGSKDGAIRNIGINNYGDECVFSVGQFFGSWLSDLGPNFLFGDVFEGAHTASCLRGCGNYADPEAYVFHAGSRADNFVELLAGASAANPRVSQAMSTWSDALEQRFGEDYVLMGEFRCKDNLNDIAQVQFSSIPPSSVRVGYDLNPSKHCEAS